MARNGQEAGVVLCGVTPWISKEKVWPLLSMCMLCWLSGHFIIKTTLTGESRLRFITSLAHRGNKEHFSKMASTWDVSASSSCPALMQMETLRWDEGAIWNRRCLYFFLSFSNRTGAWTLFPAARLNSNDELVASGNEDPATSWEPNVLFNKLVQKRHKCRSANCHKAHIHQQGPDFVLNPPYWIQFPIMAQISTFKAIIQEFCDVWREIWYDCFPYLIPTVSFWLIRVQHP